MYDFINPLVGAATGIAQTAFNNWLGAESAEKSRERNFYYNEQASINADVRQRRMYNDFYSPEALMKQYKQAGLSPSMMFGGTPGQGGASGNMSAGAAGIQNPVMPYNFLDSAQAIALLAQAKKTEAETKQIEPMAEASIAESLAKAGHEKAAGAAAEAQAAGQKLHNIITSETIQESIYKICAEAEEAGYRAEEAYNSMKSAKVLAEVNQETLKEQIQSKRNEMNLLAQKIAESKSLTHLNGQQQRKLKNDILGMWDNLDRQWEELEINKQQADTYTEWINAQIPNIEKQLNIRLQELDIENKRMIIDAVTGTIKSLAFGAMAAASFAGGKGSNATPANATQVLKKKASGGNAVTKYDKVPIYKNDYTWAY